MLLQTEKTAGFLIAAVPFGTAAIVLPQRLGVFGNHGFGLGESTQDWYVLTASLLGAVSLLLLSMAARSFLVTRGRWGYNATHWLYGLQALILLNLSRDTYGSVGAFGGHLGAATLIVLTTVGITLFRMRHFLADLVPDHGPIIIFLGKCLLVSTAILWLGVLGSGRIQNVYLAMGYLVAIFALSIHSWMQRERLLRRGPLRVIPEEVARTLPVRTGRVITPNRAKIQQTDGLEGEPVKRLEPLETNFTEGEVEIDHDSIVAESKMAGVHVCDIKFRTFASIGSTIVGQDTALKRVEMDLKQALSGLSRDPKRPLWSFLFMGPSGVGKTETAKMIAAAVYGDASRIARFNMNEAKGEGAQWRAFGPPRGYKGSDHGGLLTAQIQKLNGSCVILLDELEKGAQEIFDGVMTALDEGYVEDASAGLRIPITDSVIVMTSNIMAGHKDLHNTPEDILRADLIQAKVITDRGANTPFRPEFVGRIQRVVPFAPIGTEHLEQLILQCYQEVARQLKEAMKIDAPCMTLAVLKFLMGKLDSAEGGARQVKRVVTQTFFDFVTEHDIKPIKTPVFWNYDQETQVLALVRKDALPETLKVSGDHSEQMWNAAITTGVIRE